MHPRIVDDPRIAGEGGCVLLPLAAGLDLQERSLIEYCPAVPLEFIIAPSPYGW
jgi:hypothetical protein